MLAGKMAFKRLSAQLACGFEDLENSLICNQSNKLGTVALTCGLGFCGNCGFCFPILFSLSAAMDSMVLRMRGYISSTMLK